MFGVQASACFYQRRQPKGWTLNIVLILNIVSAGPASGANQVLIDRTQIVVDGGD